MRLTEKQYKVFLGKSLDYKANKYGNKKVVYDGIKFDSQKERNHYIGLKMLEKIGEIRDLELQKEFVLQPSFKKNGKTYRKISYIADFCYFDNRANKYIVEDVKSQATRTQLYMVKKKMLLYKYEDIEFKEVI